MDMYKVCFRQKGNLYGMVQQEVEVLAESQYDALEKARKKLFCEMTWFSIENLATQELVTLQEIRGNQKNLNGGKK